MSKCLDDELYDIYIEDGKQIIESLREIYEKGRNDAIDECEKEIKKHYQYDCEIGGYIRLCELNFEQLKDSK